MYRVYPREGRFEALCTATLVYTMLILCYVAFATPASGSLSSMQEDLSNKAAHRSPTCAVSGDKNKPFLELTKEQKLTLIENLKKVKLGDNREEVEAIIGKPWRDELVVPKESNKPTGRLVTYYVRKLDKDLVNEKYDQFVLLRFDTGDKLRKVISRTPGIETRQ